MENKKSWPLFNGIINLWGDFCSSNPSFNAHILWNYNLNVRVWSVGT